MIEEVIGGRRGKFYGLSLLLASVQGREEERKGNLPSDSEKDAVCICV